ncbi:hypothetical protein DPMN_070816 [Dreissena polymorpha]|uniref:Uncharacterized protein n=1 Tax=Dreissena polymorpha TaxID=45954 RepID=A0A9D3Z5V0_DREPO|nr:hypothetical protein DPMN_070816 [Dreissena polymorpha]
MIVARTDGQTDGGDNHNEPVNSQLTLPTKHKLYVSGCGTIYTNCIRNNKTLRRTVNVATRVLTRKNAPPPGGHIFQPTGIIFELIQNIFGMNLLTEFHEDRTINVASRVKNAPPLGSHVFQANVTIFELFQDIIETNLLTKFHVDWTLNVASGELKRLMLTPRNAQRTS